MANENEINKFKSKKLREQDVSQAILSQNFMPPRLRFMRHIFIPDIPLNTNQVLGGT